MQKTKLTIILVNKIILIFHKNYISVCPTMSAILATEGVPPDSSWNELSDGYKKS
jgi:hypothetical protein